VNIAARLGKNAGGYFGEGIDIEAVLKRMDVALTKSGWTRDPGFLAYRRGPEAARQKVYISTGIHGDEPAGPLSVLQMAEENQWPKDLAIWLCPCLNPTGFPLNRRENAAGIDLNRDYRNATTEEIRAHVLWLGEQPNFDLTICLHEDWESAGFYLYEINLDGRRAFGERVIEAVSALCPIDRSSKIEDWEASGGIISPNVKPEERPQWAEALYLIVNKTRQGYTMEAPSDFPLTTRVAALVTAVRTILTGL
jgi:protein MpaA